MSRPQVTITLGSSGQVVKRAGHVSDNGWFKSPAISGNKLSIRDRTGSRADRQFHNKRRWGGSDLWSPKDARIDRKDLRFKLMRKNKSRHTRRDVEEQNHLNLHGKLPRTVHSPVSTHTLQCMPEPKATIPLRQIPPTRNADDLLKLNSLKKSYSGWTHDGLRCGSPDRIFGASRGLSPPKHIIGLQQVPTFRPVDAPRAVPYMDREVYFHAGPTSCVPFLTKSNLPLEAVRPVPRLPPASGILQKNSYLGEELIIVGNFLHSLGLGKYAVLLQAEEVDMTALKQMRDNDLKELGIPMGPRKKILIALSHWPVQV